MGPCTEAKFIWGGVVCPFVMSVLWVLYDRSNEGSGVWVFRAWTCLITFAMAGIPLSKLGVKAKVLAVAALFGIELCGLRVGSDAWMNVFTWTVMIVSLPLMAWHIYIPFRWAAEARKEIARGMESRPR